MNGIRTVVAFCGEKKEVERYEKLLQPARKAITKRGFATGFGEAVIRSIFFLSTALAFWYGLHLILEDRDRADKKYTPAILSLVH